MKRLAIALSAALPLIVFAPAQAQKLEPGKWTGTVSPPGEPATEVTYDVTMKGDTINMTINAGEHGSFAASEMKLNDKTLTFWFAPGPRVECTLTRREDGAFAGSCLDPDGGNASMVMIPPKKE
jgi:hypothetical protein